MADVNEGSLKEMEALVGEGVTSFKLFMAYPGVFYSDDGQDPARAAEGRRDRRPDHDARRERHRDRRARRAGAGARARPTRATTARSATQLLEAEATHRAIKLAQVAGAPIYIVHLSAAQGPRGGRQGPRRGLQRLRRDLPAVPVPVHRRPGPARASRAPSTSARRRCGPREHQAALWRGLRTERPVGGVDRPLPVLLQGAEGDGARRLLEDPERAARRRDPDGPAAPGRGRRAHLAAALDRDRLRHAGADVRALPAQGHDRAGLGRRRRRLRPDRDAGALGVDAPHGRRLLLLRGPRDHRQGPDGAVARPGDRRRRASTGVRPGTGGSCAATRAST